MKILVIIVNYKSDKELLRCISSLKLQSKKITILIISNSVVEERTINTLKELEVTFIQNYENIGFGRAVNKGLVFALDNNYEYVVLCNPDVEILDKSLIVKLINASKDFNNKAIVSPVHFSDVEQTALDHNFEKYISLGTFINSKTIEVPFVNAALWLIHINIIKRLGGFDPIFFLYGEDRNYVHRASDCGIRILINTKSTIVHYRISKLVSTEKYKADLNGYMLYLAVHSSSFLQAVKDLLSTFISKTLNKPRYILINGGMLARISIKLTFLRKRKSLYKNYAFLK